MLDFLLGTAVLVAPAGNLQLLAGVAALKGAVALKKRVQRRHQQQQDEDAHGAPSGKNNTLCLESPTPEYKVAPVTLKWDNLSCHWVSKKKKKQKKGAASSKQILFNLSGAVQPGRLLAIMGPSGSGKTTLLNALANHVPANTGMKLAGRIYVNDVPSTEGNHRQAYVEQTDNFYSMLTVAETLTMASQLQLPPSMPAERKTDYVNNLISVLGLAKSRETRVGDNKVRGLSGGEKKRLAIGCELISSPSLIFLDEPTTGLDSFQAEKVVGTLKDLASSGHTVVCSIHQPRSSIFAMFDDLLLLSEGRCVYWGPADIALDYFEQLGHSCPQHYNPAEFVADLISIDYSSPDAEAESKARVQGLVDAWNQKADVVRERIHRSPGGVMALGAVSAGPVAGWFRQFSLLLRRSWRQITRDKAAAMARLSSNISSAAIFGAIFFRMQKKQSNIQDRMGLLQVAAINTAMSALVKTIGVFPKERTIVSRERTRKAYNVLPYLTAKLLAELPVSCVFPLVFGGMVYPFTGLNPKPNRFAKFLGILTLESFTAAALGLSVGAFAPSQDAATAIGPAVMLVWIIFGGYYCNADNIPRYASY
eukprot:GHRR01018823.1.p1 GENE.GHRR01018823.1~~GHRR01018823.1.p1  ORF type:complete len:592 (+),score=216.60 GHRR01018823.1:138-1913(+)